ncbi:MAG: hypothetical protein AB7I19_18550 [Planctomycetota bacterium]
MALDAHLHLVLAERSHAGRFYEPLPEVLLFALQVSFLAIGALRRSAAADAAKEPAEALLCGARDWLVVNLIVFMLSSEKREVYCCCAIRGS